MRLLSLNTWGGRCFPSLTEYIASQSETTDVFCFQEILNTPEPPGQVPQESHLYAHLQTTLPEHTGYFAPTWRGYDLNGKVAYPVEFGLASFVKRQLTVRAHLDHMIHGKKFERGHSAESASRNMQALVIQNGSSTYTIANVHGLYTGNGKSDTASRLAQSRKILKIMDQTPNKRVIIGDFNLTSDTQSINILERHYRNLNKEFGIDDTRSPLYTKNCREADYAFASNEIIVRSFRADPVIVSDHLPLILDIK